MQPALYSNVRNNLTNLPRSISPLLGTTATPSSVSSASSIRSLSPSRHTSKLRSRSSSPTPQRFASVLAYHAAPVENGKRSLLSENSPYQQHSHELEGNGSFNGRERGDNDRDESPSRIAFRNLEENWKRCELDSVSTNISSANITSRLSPSRPASPLSRPISPSPKQPYRELIECASITESQDIHENKNGTSNSESDNLSRTLINQNHANNDYHSQQGNTKSTDSALSDNKSGSAPLLKSETTTAAEATNHVTWPAQGYGSAILSSSEARHILDLPSLLGKDPSSISESLAMPFSGQPLYNSSKEKDLSASIIGSESKANASGEQTSSSSFSSSISDFNAEAEKSAQALTKQYSFKNLNMSETEAHRMVQIMAEEIVSLHEERNSMIQKLEQAKKEMLEAAKLLRARATLDAENSDNTESQTQQDTFGGKNNNSSEGKNSSDEAITNSYDKDEWKS